MAKYEVEITKVFGLAVTKTVTVEAENEFLAVDTAKDSDWKPVYDSITPNNLSESYEIAEIVVNGKRVEHTFYNHELLNEAIDINRESTHNT